MTSPHQQKLKIAGPVVITANRLADGAVVYRTAAGGWSTRIGEAAVATAAPEASRLLADAVAEDGLVVGAYVAPVALAADGRVAPGNLRERIRVEGPTFELPAIFGV